MCRLCCMVVNLWNIVSWHAWLSLSECHLQELISKNFSADAGEKACHISYFTENVYPCHMCVRSRSAENTVLEKSCYVILLFCIGYLLLYLLTGILLAWSHQNMLVCLLTSVSMKLSVVWRHFSCCIGSGVARLERDRVCKDSKGGSALLSMSMSIRNF